MTNTWMGGRGGAELRELQPMDKHLSSPAFLAAQLSIIMASSKANMLFSDWLSA